ncbi:MAG TPA: RNA polymerase sigma factor SigJ [Phytomonospora sp.]
MSEHDRLAEHFESHRTHLRAVAYRMLGSVAEAEDAVQDAWLRLSRAEAAEIQNLAAWLTTVVARVCLNILRTRKTHPEQTTGVHMPDPIVSRSDAAPTPEEEALLSDSVGLAMLVVLDTLGPAERLSFVLHDMFAVPFDDIAPIVGRTATATRQLASRARRRVQEAAPSPDGDAARQREIVDAFYAASRDGDFEALVSLLDPDVVLRADGGTGMPALSMVLSGAHTIASQASMWRRFVPHVWPATINGMPGVVVAPEGRTMSVMSFTVVDGRVAAIDVLADPERIAALGLAEWRV